MKGKFLSVLATGSLALSLLAPITSAPSEVEAATTPKWDVERYGDRIDIDAQLERLSESEDFLKQAKEKIKEQAENINFNETKAEESNNADSQFTFNGGTKSFLDRNLGFQKYTLRSVGDNVEIWVANDLSFPEGDPRPAHVVTQEQVDKLRDEFDSNIYPKATEFFGNPDVHTGTEAVLEDLGIVPEGYYTGSDKVIMLVSNIPDENYEDPTYPFFVAGFYWSTLEMYMDRNIISIDTNSWETRLESTFFGTTIHELQHLIHDDNDSDETSWVNEGMSTFSEYLGGYGHDAGSINFYLDHPENSLTSWDEHVDATTGPETIADYGQVYLFHLYMNDRFGQEFIRDLAKEDSNSITGINNTLAAHGINTDFTQLYQDFMTTLAIDSGKNDFKSIDLRELPVDDEGTKRGMTVNYEKANTFEKEGVPAWGGDFKELDFEEKIRSITFDGVDFLAVPWESVQDPLGSDNEVLWGNEGHEADNALIFEADLSTVDTATLQFDNYIDIEEQWDFGVVQVSTDGGQTWTSLANENTRSDVVANGYPKIKENLPGFTGHYEDWQQETFDLSEYAGQKVHISFRYLTDWGYNDSGWFIDNIEIPEIGYTNDGSSTDSFQSLSELLQEYVEYTVTFINEREVGNNNGAKLKHKVVTVDPFNVTEEDALQLRQLFKNGKNYMITSYAAPQDKTTPVDFTYEIKTKKDKKK
ncbi:choice-of-anchor J domain-containing protein [Alkalihalobacillus sp. AL-G]|uniref:choice-of-anchor J domain-containing protein n=1 Tax=Alkalihalobacillus sp. AL-G TaxID=2926399 RepID=UPI00272ADF53|nr:choice-of-anchor J domain-containing protein [Alkalihalobacillus sp. AL-G]WLD93291.1 immune inhibitor A [Alkalihalobacillus sp. AL-G]